MKVREAKLKIKNNESHKFHQITLDKKGHLIFTKI